MVTLMDTCFELIPVTGFVEVVVKALSDPAHDIKMMSMQMINRLFKLNPASLTASLESTAQPLKAIIEFKTKSSAVKQEVDKNQDLIVSALKTLFSLGLGSSALSTLAKEYKAPGSTFTELINTLGL
jgi:cullin-associated NEDD8-dissociated protein 1